MNNALNLDLRKILITSVFLISPFATKAQVHNENALLWEVSGNGLEQPSFIFGVLKFIPSEDYFLPQTVIDKMNSCKILSTETLLDHHAKHELNKAAHLDHHESLDDYLNEEEFAELKEIFDERLGVGGLKFNLVYKNFKPIMLSTTMTRLAVGDVHYYELDLINKAQENDMLIMGLETVEREVEALEKFTLEDQVSALKHTIDNFDEQLEDYNILVEAYKEGNLHKTLEYFMHPVENNQQFKKFFIVERNKEWVPKMVNYMNEAPTFFALGTSHLADEDGIIHLLVEEGYNIKPIKNLN